MDVAPVVHMAREKGGDHPQPPHLRHLVPAQQLGVDHHRPHGCQIHTLPGRGLQRRQILCAGGVSVAVGQQLHVLRPGPTDHIQHLSVRQGAVAPVVRLPRVGPPQPGGAALGGAVQEHLVPAQLEVPLIPPDAFRKGPPGRLHTPGVPVSHHVQRQGPVRQQRLVQRQQRPVQHPLLDRGDTVGGIEGLGPPAGCEKAVCRWQRHPPLIQEERVLLHHTCECALRPLHLPALRAGRVSGDTQPLQGRCIERAHVSGLVTDDHRVLRRRRIQTAPVRMTAL